MSCADFSEELRVTVSSWALTSRSYIHRMAAAERGADLEGLSINATLETFQVDVFTNTSQSDVGRIMSVVADVFKEMRFKVIALPEFNEGDTYRSTARFQRVIGANDSLT